MLRNFFIPLTDGIGHEKRKSDKIEVLDFYRIPGHFKAFFLSLLDYLLFINMEIIPILCWNTNEGKQSF